MEEEEIGGRQVSSRQEITYNKSRPLESIFQNTTARVLDFLILNQKFDYSAAEMSKITQIPLRTIQRVLPHLVEKEMIKETGKIGNTRMYMFNTHSELTDLLKQYVLATINKNIDKARKQLQQQQQIQKNNVVVKRSQRLVVG
jgi:DNA-binding transcriptional regulator YhcF (GntR family)